MHCRECTCPGRVPAWGVPAQEVYLPKLDGGVPAKGVYLGGVPARGVVPAWGVYLPGGCTSPGGVPGQGVYLARGCTYLGDVHAPGTPPVNIMTGRQV